MKIEFSQAEDYFVAMATRRKSQLKFHGDAIKRKAIITALFLIRRNVAAKNTKAKLIFSSFRLSSSRFSSTCTLNV
jgi:hypothetical protein